MRLLTKLAVFLLLLHSCKSSENRKQGFHNLNQSVLPILATNNISVDTFYRNQFSKVLDTMKFKGENMPLKVSILEYYAGSAYTVTHLKFLFATYREKGWIYFFKFEDNNWMLKWSRETTSLALDSINLSIKKSIDEDKSQLAKDSSEYIVGDIAKFSVRENADKSEIMRLTINKPGNNLLNSLMNIKKE